MTFALKILFIGLIAFVPSDDGKELTALLLDAEKGYAASDGSWVDPHQPMVIALAGSCQGDCQADASIASFLFPDLGAQRAEEALAAAMVGGAAWSLDTSELTVRSAVWDTAGGAPPLVLVENTRDARDGEPAPIPDEAEERRDLSWVAPLSSLAPSGKVDPDVLAPSPQKGLVAARMELRSGKVTTRRLITVSGMVVPLGFRPLQEAQPIPFQQALAEQVLVEVEVEGDSVELIESVLGGDRRRSIILTPHDGVVEVAVLNVPQAHFQHSSEPLPQHPDPGSHFEIYYEILAERPPNHLRPVPYALGLPGIDQRVVHPIESERSPLLEAIGLGDNRGVYDRVICPVAQGGG